MNIIFFGNGSFALQSLKELNKSSKHKILLTVTNEDKKRGRGLKKSSSIVSKFCIENSINLYKCDNIRTQDFFIKIKEYNPECFVVIEYRILPKKLLEIPKYGSVNIHASLLPSYRGAAPIQRSIMNGETIFGVSSFLIEEKIDTGNIIKQKKCKIDDSAVFHEVYEKLSIMGSSLLLESLDKIKFSDTFIIQNDKLSSNAPKIIKDEYKISFNETAENIHNKIRALFPKTYASINSKKVRLFDTYYSNDISSNEIGNHFLLEDTLHIRCKIGTLLVKGLQFENKNRITSKDFNNMTHLNNVKFK